MMFPKAHQRSIRERVATVEASGDLFGAYWEQLDTSIGNAILREIRHPTAKNFIMKYEWLGTMCNAPIASYGIYFDDTLGGVIVFGAVSPPSVAASIAGEEYAKTVIQLSRGACAHWSHQHSASKLIGYGLREMEKKGYRIALAYADPAAGEIGTVYQATNWMYCGLTEQRPDYFDESGKLITGPVGKVRPGMTRRPKRRKGKYIYIMGDKREKRAIKKSLHLSQHPYPKRDNPPAILAEQINR